MDDIFKLKYDIPDNDKNSFESFFYRAKNIICFLLSYEVNETILISAKYNKNYHLGNINKNQKTISINYIELPYRDSDDLEIKINNKSLFIRENKYNDDKIFLFNNYLYEGKEKDNNKNKNNKRKLNCFNINEEFEIYYNIHSENIKYSFGYLIKSAINIIKNKDPCVDFSFFLTLFIKKKGVKFESIPDIIKNIKKKGDLTKISKEDLYKIVSQVILWLH